MQDAGVEIADLGLALLHEPVQVRAVWRTSLVTTRQPVAGSYQLWWVETVFSSSVPILMTLVLRSGDEMRYGRFGASGADVTVEAKLAFHPYAYWASNDVQVSFSQHTPTCTDGIRALLTSEQLKRDPPSFVQVLLSEEQSATTGVAYRVAELDKDAAAEVVLVAKADTLNKKGRWRLRPEKTTGLPSTYGFLAHGTRSGTWRAESETPR